MNEFIIRVLKEQEIYSERARVLEQPPPDEEKNTCSVETLDNKSIIHKVLFSGYRGAQYGLFLVPKIGSVVTINYYSKDEAYIATPAELERVKLIYKPADDINGVSIDIIKEKILIEWPESEEGTTVEISEEQILVNSEETIFNGGELLGMVKVEEMTARLNDLESLWTQIQMDFNTWVPVPMDGGAALKATLSAGILAQIVPNSQVGDFENEKIKQ
jgi:hypothetical protein